MKSKLSEGIPGRPVRQPVSQRVVLSAPQKEGFTRRWVNDVKGRVKMFQEGGWAISEEFGPTADDSRMAESSLGSVNTRYVGNDVTAVLMEIPDELYKEDQAAKAANIKAVEKDILTKKDHVEGQYGEITVKR